MSRWVKAAPGKCRDPHREGMTNAPQPFTMTPPLAIHRTLDGLAWNPGDQGFGIAELTLEPLYDSRRLSQNIQQVTNLSDRGLIAMLSCGLNQF